jgi:hypothetical protein
LLISACVGKSIPLATPNPPLMLPTETLLAPLPVVVTPTITCIDRLSFLDDVTIPDNTIVAPGSQLDKRWLVMNSGSCNWDYGYRLRLVGGSAMGATPEQSLFPARAGTQAILRIFFTVPLETGNYLSEWQAFDPNGIPFGEVFFIKIIVE